ncbi:MAG: hypothetical protein ACOX0E_05515 [Syntrophomonadaceae bacterium]|jgi:predicted DNA-binding transcriptional regulator YafY
MAADKELITVRAMAEALGFSEETISRYIRENKSRRDYRYKLDESIKALQANVIGENTHPHETEPSKKLT